jgi:hypothetical protein
MLGMIFDQIFISCLPAASVCMYVCMHVSHFQMYAHTKKNAHIDEQRYACMCPYAYMHILSIDTQKTLTLNRICIYIHIHETCNSYFDNYTKEVFFVVLLYMRPNYDRCVCCTLLSCERIAPRFHACNLPGICSMHTYTHIYTCEYMHVVTYLPV